MVGQTFGRLTVVGKGVSPNPKRVYWHCVCACGNEKDIHGYSLTTGHTTSCGCLHKEISGKILRDHLTTHGGTKERLFGVWSSMKNRCYCVNDPCYKNYGGRGIGVCDLWRNSYVDFRQWAYENGYDENAPKYECTIDRINVDEDYSPENCRWATMKQQDNNKRNTRYLEYNGKRQSLSLWAEEKGMSKKTLHERLKRGWSVEDALTRPIQEHSKPERGLL